MIDWCKEMSSYTRVVRWLSCMTLKFFLTVWRQFFTSFSAKRFDVHVVEKSQNEHFLAEKMDILA